MVAQPSSALVFAEQVRQLYRLFGRSYPATLVSAAIVTGVLWGVASDAMLLAWLAVMVMVIAARYALYAAYMKSPRDPDRARAWARRFIAGAGATGLWWGWLGSALFPASSTHHQLLVIFLLGGMVISAAVILAPVRHAFPVYMVPLMVPLTGAVFAQGGDLHLLMGVLLLVFSGVMLATAPSLSDMMRESLRVKFENSDLVEQLSHANRDLSGRIEAQQAAAAALRRSEERYRGMFEANPVPMWIRDELTMAVLAANGAAVRSYGYSLEEFLRLRAEDLLAPEEAGRFQDEVRKRDPALRYVNHWRHRRKDGSVMEVETISSPFELAGRPARLVLANDITERNRAERLRNLETAVTVLLADAVRVDEVMPRVLDVIREGLDFAYGALLILDDKEGTLRCVETCSEPDPDPALEEFRGMSAARTGSAGRPGGLSRRVWATGTPVWLPDIRQDHSLLRREAAERAGLRCAFAFPILVGGEFHGVMEFLGRDVRPQDDRAIEVARTIGSHIAQFIGRKQAEDDLQFVASHDPLTGLFNRGMFGERLHQALAQAQRFERTLALLFIDLDGFKLINDTLGHNAGDAALVEIAARLRASLREGDVIARMGGDEFVVLVEQFGEAVQVVEVARKVLDTVSRPVTLQSQEYSVTASIGVCTYPHDAADAQTLLKNADIAMYRAKEGGKNNFRFFAPEMNVHLIERLSLESGLKRALERDELKLLYQPKVSIRSGAIVGIEALVRWQHPAQGLIGPQEFVPIAEDTGLMNAIGGWVLRTACTQMRAWQEQGLTGARIAVNLSTRQFMHEGLIQVVRQALHDAQLEPARLELEITEGMVIRNPERAVKALAQLREVGVRVTLDDFGTGYSSLGYLMRCPVDGVKLDRSFVLRLPGDANSVVTARAVIAMAHSLELHVTAEGVETREQWDLLRSLECDEMQGNYYSEPVTADDMAALLRQANGAGRRAVVQALRSRRGDADPEPE